MYIRRDVKKVVGVWVDYLSRLAVVNSLNPKHIVVSAGGFPYLFALERGTE